MIQRIQSLYLLFSGLGIFSLFKLPFATTALKTNPLFADGLFNLQDSNALMILVSAAGTLLLISIFLFKNRLLQRRVTMLSILVVLGIIGTAIFTFQSGNTNGADGVNVAAGTGMPLLSIILALLAFRGINKDQDLVKSMDRLR